MSRAVDGSLEALGLDGHEALIVAHDDTRHPHVHMIANRVDPRPGRAAKLDNSKLRLFALARGLRAGAGPDPGRAAVRNNEQRRGRVRAVSLDFPRQHHADRPKRSEAVSGIYGLQIEAMISL